MGAHLTAPGLRASAYDDDGAVGETDHLLRDAADKQADEPAMATAADDDQIGVPVSAAAMISWAGSPKDGSADIRVAPFA